MQMANEAKDKYVAPHLSEFTSASIPDAEGSEWLKSYIINSTLRGRFEGNHYSYAFTFLRRAEAAFNEYSLAREQTLAYLASEKLISLYLRAIAHWEVCLFQSWHSYSALRELFSVNVFDKRHGQVLPRLDRLYNHSKHTEELVKAKQYSDGTPLCVWLTNSGLQSATDHLTFGEMANDVLGGLASFADAFQDPITALDKLRAKAASQS